MASNNTQTVSLNTGGGWVIFATIVLVVLKVNPGGHLGSVVEDWPWWLVLIPLWLGIAIVLAIFLIGGIIALVSVLISDRLRVRRHRKMLAERKKRDDARRATRLKGLPKPPKRYIN